MPGEGNRWDDQTEIRRSSRRRERNKRRRGKRRWWRPLSRRWMDSVGIQPDAIHLRLLSEERGGPPGFYFGTRSSIMFTGILIRWMSPSPSYHRRIVPSYGVSRKGCSYFSSALFIKRFHGIKLLFDQWRGENFLAWSAVDNWVAHFAAWFRSGSHVRKIERLILQRGWCSLNFVKRHHREKMEPGWNLFW